MFTRVSVVCAERMVATRSWKGLPNSSAHSASGYSRARRRATSRARPLTVRGRRGREPSGAGTAIGAAGYALVLALAPIASGRAPPRDQAADDADRHRGGVGPVGGGGAGRRPPAPRRPRVAGPRGGRPPRVRGPRRVGARS